MAAKLKTRQAKGYQMSCDRCGKAFRHCDSYFIVVVPIEGALNVHGDCRYPSEYPKPANRDQGLSNERR